MLKDKSIVIMDTNEATKLLYNHMSEPGTHAIVSYKNGKEVRGFVTKYNPNTKPHTIRIVVNDGRDEEQVDVPNIQEVRIVDMFS